MLLQHQFESMCADLKSKGDTHALKVDYEQQLADLRRRAETSHAEQESAIQRQRAEAETYILEQRAAYDEEQRQREAAWNAEKARAEAVFAEERKDMLQRPSLMPRPYNKRGCVWRRDYGGSRLMRMLGPKMFASRS